MSVTYNVVRNDGVFIEGMTKEQIIAAIAEATGVAVSDIDSAFITKIKEINHQNAVRIWMGTNAEYNAITEKSDDVLYVITDDTFVEDTSNELINLDNKIDANHDAMEAEFDAFKAEVDERLEEIENIINAPTKSYTFSKQYDYGDVTTFTLSDDLEIGKATTLYITINCVLEADGSSGSNCRYKYDTASAVNFKTAGNYSIMESEIISLAGIQSSWVNGGEIGNTSQKIFGVDSHDGYGINVAEDNPFPVYAVTMKIKAMRLS